MTFVDRQLATRQKKERPRWQAGLRGLDATARRRHGKPFAELPFEAQTAVLQDVEKGAVEAADWSGVEPGGLLRPPPRAHDDGLLRRPAPRREQGPRELEDARRARPADPRPAARDAAAPALAPRRPPRKG